MTQLQNVSSRDPQTELLKDKLFWLLGQIVCIAEQAYMTEHRRVLKGYAFSHVETYWAHSIFELLRLKCTLRSPQPTDKVARVGSV